MLTSFLKLLLYLVLPALTNIAGTQETSLKTITDIEDFMQSYYPSSGYLQKLNNAPTLGRHSPKNREIALRL